jgi:hypothetical protein
MNGKQQGRDTATSSSAGSRSRVCTDSELTALPDWPVIDLGPFAAQKLAPRVPVHGVMTLKGSLVAKFKVEADAPGITVAEVPPETAIPRVVEGYGLLCAGPDVQMTLTFDFPEDSIPWPTVVFPIYFGKDAQGHWLPAPKGAFFDILDKEGSTIKRVECYSAKGWIPYMESLGGNGVFGVRTSMHKHMMIASVRLHWAGA